MKHPRRNRKLNKGFSLLEVLVTLAIISVLSIPLIQSFLNSAKVNGKSKSMQNATDIAQNISEYFNAMSIDVLKSIYSGKYTEMADGRIVFNNIGDGSSTDSEGDSYYRGMDSERFYVTVVLDPAGYTGGSEGSIGDINDYMKPDINNINESGSVTCMTQINKYDGEAVQKIKEAVSGFVMEKVYRRLDFMIDQTPYSDGRVDYRYSVRVSYGYGTGTTYYLTKEMLLAEDTLPASMLKAPNLYVVYQPTFATYTSSAIDTVSSDEINFFYNNGKDKDDLEKDVHTYIISQDVKNKVGSAVSLNKDNITVKQYKNYVSNEDLNKESHKFQLYTNIPGWDVGNITTGQDEFTKLYNMNIYVWKDIKDGLVIDGDSLEIKDDECYSTLSTVKGE